MSGQHIIMSFSAPPTFGDIEDITQVVLETLPEELLVFCKKLTIKIEEFPDEALEQELKLKDPFELVTLYRSGKEVTPGVEMKTACDADVLTLFRRPLLDMWCEVCEDLTAVIGHVIIEELGQQFDFPSGDINEMVRSYHHQCLSLNE